MRVPSQRSHPCMEVRALDVKHGLKALLPYKVLLILIREKHDRQRRCSCEAILEQGVRVMCAIISMPMSGSLPTTDPDHGCMVSSGIVTLTSHLSKS
jgi:hypothetical protein